MKNLPFLFLIIVLCSTVLPAQDQATPKVNVGDKAPSFTAKDADGNTWTSSDHVGRNPIVVYFYPAAMTGGCTKQACSYRDDFSKLKAAKAEVVAISGDEPEGLKIFRKAHNLNFTLLSDPNGSVAQKFGVPFKEGGEIKQTIDGQEVTLKRGVTISRWTFVIDSTGKIAYVNSKVDAPNDSKAVLAALEHAGH